MNRNDAMTLAAIIGRGEAWHSGGGEWLVTITRADGSLVVFAEGCVAEYAGQAEFDDGNSRAAIEYVAPTRVAGITMRTRHTPTTPVLKRMEAARHRDDRAEYLTAISDLLAFVSAGQPLPAVLGNDWRAGFNRDRWIAYLTELQQSAAIN